MTPTFKTNSTNDLIIEFDDDSVRRKVTLRSRKIEHALGGISRLGAIADMLNSAVQPSPEASK